MFFGLVHCTSTVLFIHISNPLSLETHVHNHTHQQLPSKNFFILTGLYIHIPNKTFIISHIKKFKTKKHRKEETTTGRKTARKSQHKADPVTASLHMNHQNTHTKARVNPVTSRRNNSDNDQTSHPHSTNRSPCAATVSVSLSRTCFYSPCIFSINMSCLRFHVNILMQNMNILNNINMMFVVLFILGGVCKKSCVLGSCLMFCSL